MRAMQNRRSLSRRQFLKESAAAVGVISVAVRGHAGVPDANAFAYDVRRFSKTDPKLLLFEEVRRFAAPREDARRIAFGPDDQLYIAAGKSVSVLDRQGVSLSAIPLSDTARCVAVSREGEVFIGLRDHVEIFDRKGQRRASWESSGPRAWLTGLAVTPSNIFLADAGNRVVLRCDRSGKVLGRIGEKNKSKNSPGFIVPSPFFDLEMHPDGLFRVTNPGRHRVEAYTVDGDFELAWGKPSAAIDGFCGCCNPIAIALLPDGRIVTCEKGLPRVKVYSADGTFEAVVAGPESFPENVKAAAGEGLSDASHGGLDAAVNSLGEIHILDLVKGDIRVMVRKGALANPGAKASRNPS
jgi:hypothetical protein